MTEKSKQSLSLQSFFLLAGRLLSYPFTFVAPLVFVRYFSPTDFGYYKQLVILFYVIVPLVNFGFSNAILFFIPKTPQKTAAYLSSILLPQILIGSVLICASYFFQNEIGALFTKSPGINKYLPLIVLHAFFWAISNNLGEILVAEKKTFFAGLFDMLSEIGRAFFPIIAILFKVDLFYFLLSMVLVGVIRTVFMTVLFIRQHYFTFAISGIINQTIKYSIPLGSGIFARFLMSYSYMLIVSMYSSPEIFAIFSVGCFTLPILGPLLTAIARVAVVQISTLIIDKNHLAIGNIIFNANRKLWLMLFPLFLFCEVNAKFIISVLYTNTYTESIPIFQIFILSIPLMTIHLEHLPRAFGTTNYLLRLNIFVLFLSVLFTSILFYLYGIYGAVWSSILMLIIRQCLLLRMTSSFLNISLKKIIPFHEMIKVSLGVIIISLGNVFLNFTTNFPPLISLINSTAFFFALLGVMFWFFNIFNTAEKQLIVSLSSKLKNKFIANT